MELGCKHFLAVIKKIKWRGIILLFFAKNVFIEAKTSEQWAQLTSVIIINLTTGLHALFPCIVPLHQVYKSVSSKGSMLL